MSQPPKEPHNPFYLLLLVAGLIFVVTAMAYAFVPTLEDKAARAGAEIPYSPWREALRQDGWRWLLYELGALIVLAFASMGLDRLRRLQKERAAATMPQEEKEPQSPESG